MIHFDHVDLGYAGVPVLRDVTCRIRAGESVGMVGPNGSGKTTLLRGVLGLLTPLRGRIATDTSRRFAYVPQSAGFSRQWPLTVRDVVSLACRSRHPFGRVTGEEAHAIDAASEKTGVRHLFDRAFEELSGGQRQRVVLAQALSQKPDVLVLDEPTKGLDVAVEQELVELIASLHKNEGLTVLLVSHTLPIPLNISDTLLLFKDGAVVQTTPQELVATKKLEALYGIPFAHAEKDGVRWVWPERRS